MPKWISRLIPFVPIFGQHRRTFVETLPEARLFPTDESRSDAVSSARRTVVHSWAFELSHFAVLYLLFSGLRSSFAAVFPDLGVWNTIGALITAMVVTEVGVYHLVRHYSVNELRAKLVEAGVPICKRCGYDLRQLPTTSSRCPECGSSIPKDVMSLLHPEVGDEGGKVTN
jgi:predicted Zn-ribbon and HTH transcriptional regulator